MKGITIIQLRNSISPIVASQIQNIKQIERVNLKIEDLDPKETDSTMTREIKSQVKQRLEANDKKLASYAVDIVDKAIEMENEHLEIGRKLRKEADLAFAKARKLHNTRVHLIETGNVLPVALEINAVNSEDISAVVEHVKSINIPDYFSERNKVATDKTSN